MDKSTEKTEINLTYKKNFGIQNKVAVIMKKLFVLV